MVQYVPNTPLSPGQWLFYLILTKPYKAGTVIIPIVQKGKP